MNADMLGFPGSPVASDTRWQLVVNEIGNSLVNWTVKNGTWAIVNGVINQSNNTTGDYILCYTPVGQSTFGFFAGIAKVEFEFLGASSSARDGDARCAFYDGASSVSAIPFIYCSPSGGNVSQVGINVSGVVGLTFNGSLSLDPTVWHKLRVIFSGNSIAAWIDGVYQGGAVYNGSSSAIVVKSYFALSVGAFSSHGNTSFRNIKIWQPVDLTGQ